MSTEIRYYYVDAQNQAAGPVAINGLLALKAAGTLSDATLVVAEGGTEWVAFSALKPTGEAVALRSLGEGASAPAASGVRSGGASSSAEPPWASQLSEKIDRLTGAMDKLVLALEKSRPPAPVLAPATAALHAEKINLNPVPKPGIASQLPPPGASPRPTPLPAGVPVAAPRSTPPPQPTPRPGVNVPLTPLAVPANAQKSALPLPALGQPPGPAPAKGNIFSKFLKK